jgi:hypothetical protein
MGWATEGAQINPSNGDILADTGALAVGITATLIIKTNVDAPIELVRRNATNTSDFKVQPLVVAPPNLFVVSVPLGVSLNERILLRMSDDLEGTITASILW